MYHFMSWRRYFYFSCPTPAFQHGTVQELISILHFRPSCEGKWRVVTDRPKWNFTPPCKYIRKIGNREKCFSDLRQCGKLKVLSSSVCEIKGGQKKSFIFPPFIFISPPPLLFANWPNTIKLLTRSTAYSYGGKEKKVSISTRTTRPISLIRRFK